MPDLPPEVIRAAAVQHAEYRGFTDPEPEDFAIAEDMLGAAAPHIAAAERERIRQLARSEAAKLCGGPGEAWSEISAAALEDFAGLLEPAP